MPPRSTAVAALALVLLLASIGGALGGRMERDRAHTPPPPRRPDAPGGRGLWPPPSPPIPFPYFAPRLSLTHTFTTRPGAHANTRRLAQDGTAVDALPDAPAAGADVEASPSAALDGTLTQAELCAVAKTLYGAKPAACEGVPEIKVKTVPVAVGDVAAPQELVVTADGKIAAIGGGAPGAASSRRGLSKGAAAAVAVVVLAGAAGAVALGVVVAAKKRAARRVMAK